MADPWLKFYPTDWRSDPRLKLCSMAARGLWIEMICLMHEASPYGHLLVGGHRPTDAQLAVLVGAPSDQIAALLGELEAAGVFSRTREGVIYSRKLSRMAKKAATARNNGRKGGNPSLRNNVENQPLDNPSHKGGDKPQKPEARSQSKEKKEPYGSFQKKATRLSPEWTLPAPWRDWATSAGLTAAQVRDQADRFRDYWTAKPGKDAAKLDWLATWRNWVRKAVADSPQQRPPPRNRVPEYGDTRTLKDGTEQVYRGGFDGWHTVRT